MLVSEIFLKQWIADLAAATSKLIKPVTAEIYLRELSHWNLSELEWTRALAQIINKWDIGAFPLLSQIYPYLRVELMGQAPVTQAFDLRRDKHGRIWAKRIPGKFIPDHPSVADIDLWHHEACSKEEGREAFRRGYLEVGGSLDRIAEMQAAVELTADKEHALQEQRRRLQHKLFDDQNEPPF
jgi:hypothetical protein